MRGSCSSRARPWSSLRPRLPEQGGGSAWGSRAPGHSTCAPDILLLEECAANLDPSNVSLLENQLKFFISTGSNKTVVIVTHNLFQARRLCDKVALMWDGRVIEVSDTDKFFQNPDDQRTAECGKGGLCYV